MAGMDWKSKRVRAILEAALVEDKATADVTTELTVDRRLRATGSIVAQEACVVAGLGSIPVLLEIFSGLKAKTSEAAAGRFQVISHPEVFDGVKVKRGQTIAVVRASAAALLSTERVMLNLLQRMTGIATLTQEFVRAAAGTGVKVLDTRKTIPGMRILDKYAVCCGGGLNHRADLQDGILIKSNHVALGGGLGKALENAMKFRRGKQWVQVEVRNDEELRQAIAGKAESILLDHFTPAAVKRAVKLIRGALPQAKIEASGGVTLENVRKYAECGVDFISVGALTRSAAAVDLSMRMGVDDGLF